MTDIKQLTDQDLQQAIGYKGSGDIRKISDADLQSAVTADASPEMQAAKEGTQGFNPYIKALQDTGNQAIVNPAVQAINGVTPAINGINKFIQPSGHNLVIPQIQGPDMSNAPIAAKIEGDLAGGASQGLAATALGGGNPILGYGALSGASAFGKGEPVIPAAIGGATSAIPQMIAGKVGSSLASAAAKPFGGMVSKFAPNVGTALGMGGASAAQAQASGQNPVEAGSSGAVFGLLSPMNPLGSKVPMSTAQHDNLINTEGAQTYRNILNPGKGIINKIEIKSGGDINDAMSLAAREALPIQSEEGKLNNIPAIDKLKASVAPMYDSQNKILASNPDKQFDLEKLGNQVKSQLSSTTKNASDLESSKGNVDNEINAEILRHGPMVDGQTLNMIKQGMWNKSYNPLEPNANDTARQIGFAAKDAIEKAYPTDSIKETNAKIGQYLQLQKVLEATHGQVVQGGKIGKYASKGIGAATGAIAGAHIPIPGVEEAALLGGGWLGGKANEAMNDPARITSNWANKLSNINITDSQLMRTKRTGVITPEVMPTGNEKNIPLPQNQGISYNPLNALPSPRNVKYSPSQHTVMGEGSIKQGTESAPGVLTAGRPEKPYSPGQEAITNPRPGTLEHAQTFPQSQFNPLKSVQQAVNKGNSESISKPNPILPSVAAATALGAASVFNPANAQAKQVKDPNRLKLPTNQYIMKNEGWKSMPYIDTNGHKTVGYGFKEGGMAWKYVPDAVKNGQRAMTKDEGTYAFNKAYPNAVSSAYRFAGDSWDNLSINQQKSLVDMSYQMGSLHGFPKLRAAIENGNYNTASREILNSKYARKDAPERAKQNAILMQQ